MAEELVLDIKTDIKSATADTKEWGKSIKDVSGDINFQKKMLIELEKSLIDLEKAQSKLTPWENSLNKTTSKIKAQKHEIKEQKNAIKTMAHEQKIATDESKKFTAAQKKQNEAFSGTIGNFKVMGVSLNGIKSSFGKIIPAAKAMFGTIKAGIASTGIGLLLVAFGSLATFFTSTKRGADQLDRAFTAVGATIDVLKDRISKIGEAISFVFSGEFKKAGDALKGTFAGIADEIEREVAAMTALKQRTQELRDADMEFMVQKAATRQEIEKARLIAEDETKSAKERLDNLKKALELEEETTKRELVLAKERMDIQIEEMRLSENSAEDERKLAELKVALIEKETASVKMRRRVVTEVNALDREIAAEQKARSDERLKQIEVEKAALQEIMDLEIERLNKQVIDAAALLDAHYQSQLDAHTQEKNAIEDKWFSIIEAEEEGSERRLELETAYKEQLAAVDAKYNEDKVKGAKKSNGDLMALLKQEVKWSELTADEKLKIASDTASQLSQKLGEETAAGKAAAIIAATIDTYKSATASYASLAGIPVVGPVLGGIAAAAAITSGMMNVKAIMATGGGGGGGGAGAGAAAGAVGAGAGAAAQTPAPQMMSGAFELTGGQEVEPTRAYVVSDDITASQNGLEVIRRRATI